MTVRQLRGSQYTPDKRLVDNANELLSVKAVQAKEAQQQKVENDRQMRAQEREATRLLREKEAVQASQEAARESEASETLKAHGVVKQILGDPEDGGFGFGSLKQFFDALWRPGGDRATSSLLSKYVEKHGADHARNMFRRSNQARDDYISEELAKILQKEGRAIQALLTREWTTSVTDLLQQFSMEDLTVQLEQVAPTLWETLGLVSTPDQSTRRQSSGDNRRDKSLVFTTICALVSVLRSQKANNFQMVVGLFLLGSGASKREISVLAHAGLSISYALIIDHVKKLSTEGLVTIQEVFRTSMVQIVWDNLNIAFRIAEQRMGSKNHFDSGTTATMIPVFDPATGKHAAHGTLPLETNPSRERTLPVLDWTADDILPSPQEAEQISQTCLWQLKRIALEHIPGVTDVLRESLGECPTVHQIPLHKTEQYPLPAMKLDESSLDGTIEVYETILRNIGVNDEALRKHGIMFDDGDLLTDSLKEKVYFQSAIKYSTDWC
ncbi:hypothetical protein MIND_01347800 [Mycena indigotica]|uniref:DUF6589 domain-containing protein n=1 Tax=Mycena indigotica TaxID=2126181 RepID=A0A8H6VPX3_9AGAR|nr:uncharacterized protein MIND_01347800 [Mycena indigotica]KAF7289742.1 hypothetical protein MIND_01347800 [Mycena indigotica]